MYLLSWEAGKKSKKRSRIVSRTHGENNTASVGRLSFAAQSGNYEARPVFRFATDTDSGRLGREIGACAFGHTSAKTFSAGMIRPSSFSSVSPNCAKIRAVEPLVMDRAAANAQKVVTRM